MNNSASARSQPPYSTSSPTFYARPSLDRDHYAIGRFITHFVETTSTATPGYMEFLPHMLQRTFDETRNAILAVSLASLSNVSRNQELRVESLVYYGRALQSLRAAMNDHTTAIADSTMLNIVIIQMYDTIAGTNDLIIDKIDHHEIATTELLRLRSSTPHASETSRKLSEIVKTRKEILLIHNCSRKESGSYTPLSPAQSFRFYLREVSTACARLLQTRQSSFRYSSSFIEALDDAVGLYAESSRWPASTSVEWRYRPHLPPKDISAQGISQIFLFKDIQHSGIWQLYFCSRIHLCQALLGAYSFLHSEKATGPTSNRSQLSGKDIRKTLLAAVDDIISCAPYLLGDVDDEGHMVRSNIERKGLGAFFLLRGLMVAISARDLLQRQRRLLLDLLNRIGVEFGIHAAWRLREDWIASHRTEAAQL
ncbi:hypothetical protein B0J11DRAFT_603397 [Dendryphion nanum]|uniref:Uncharacterized protein n=1 Tax=Dendryphion nanum TaxID=256645 RepID=A0A9P9DZP7_9PLEO|nr:hypothetical protein B0J11DRAFT_603397 [Dendryphion nanum]